MNGHPLRGKAAIVRSGVLWNPCGGRPRPGVVRDGFGARRGAANGLVACGLCLVLLGVAGPAVAEDAGDTVVDPLEDGQVPPDLDLGGSVYLLEPTVTTLEPVVRSLQTEEREGERTTVTISSDVLFDFDSADLTTSAERVVSRLAERIAATDSDVAVVGHTDGIGSRDYNQRLSERRAEAVADVLQQELGDGRAITTEGRNFSEPIADETVNGEDNPEGRARNRRVEITFAEPS